MKRLTAICLFAVFLAACGNGKNEPVAKDSVASTSGTSIGAGTGSADSTNGAVVTPIDTANANRQNPQ